MNFFLIKVICYFVQFQVSPLPKGTPSILRVYSSILRDHSWKKIQIIWSSRAETWVRGLLCLMSYLSGQRDTIHLAHPCPSSFDICFHIAHTGTESSGSWPLSSYPDAEEAPRVSRGAPGAGDTYHSADRRTLPGSYRSCTVSHLAMLPHLHKPSPDAQGRTVHQTTGQSWVRVSELRYQLLFGGRGARCTSSEKSFPTAITKKLRTRCQLVD